MAILNHGSTLRTADGGQTTTTIVTAANIGTYGVATNSTYYVGTTQNIFNRASGAQTLTGVSIDGNAANITAYTINQNVGTANAPSFAGATLTSTLSITGGDGLRAFRAGAATITSHLYWANTTNTVAYNWQLDENNNAAMWGYTSAWGKLLTVTSAGAFSASGDVRAPIFYDSANTAYYLDPANTGTSLLVAGNVGIGNTSPSAKLHVSGASYTTASAANNNVRFEGGGGNGLGFGTIDATSTYASWIQSGYVPNFTTATYALLLNPLGGNVGIGATSPLTKLDIANTQANGITMRYDTNTAYQAWIRPYWNSGTDTRIDFAINRTANVTPDVIMSVGYGSNVGIGTTSPSQKLHVVGTGFASTDFRAPIFYDSDNTAYYVDAASTSVINALSLTVLNNINAANGVWHNSAEGKERFYFGSNSHTYFKTAADFIFRNNSNIGVVTIDSVGNLRTSTSGDNFASYSLHVGGTGFATADFRSPIFYDSNNTAYYIDAASTSVLNRLTIDGGNYAFDYFQSLSDFTSGTLVTTDIPATAAEGESFVMNVVGKSYSASNSPFNFTLQGYLYNSTIINFSGIKLDSTGLTSVKIFENGGVLCFWWPTISYWNAFEVSVRAYNSAKNNYNRVTNITNSTEPVGTKKVTVTLQSFLRADVSATNSVDLRAPIFYDSNDTTYYTDPSSLSNILELKTNKNWYDSSASAWGGGINMGGNNPSIGFQSTASTWWYMLHHSSSNINFYRRSTSGSWSQDAIWDNGGNLIWQVASVRAPIFYDQNNTAYYIDAASTSSLNALTMAGTITGALDATASFTGGVCTAASYNYVLNGANDTGNKLVIFVNGSTRTADGGVNALTIRNDGGTFVLGLGSYLTSILGSSVTINSNVALHAGNYNSYALPLTGGQITGNTTFSADNHLTFGPNSTWGSSIRIGGNGYTATGTEMASVVTTDGNLHLDAAKSTNGIYLNWYGGTSGVFFGNGSSGQVAFVSNTGNASFSGVVDATQFRDASNTAYYLDPNSLSNIRHTIFDIGSNVVGATGIGVLFDGNYTSGQYRHRFRKYDDGNGLPLYVDYAHATANSFTAIARFGGGGTYNPFSVYGTADASGDFRAPIFYDSNNTAYYVDPNSTSNLVGLTVANTITGNINGYANYISAQTNPIGAFNVGLTRPKGASYTTTASSVTGAIKIKMPPGIPVHGMWKMTIKVYEYGSRGNGYTIECGCHLYPSTAYNRYQYAIGVDANIALTIRYGTDGTSGCIWIGENATTWSYPQIHVTEFSNGFNNPGNPDWNAGTWGVTIGTIDNSVAVDGPYTISLPLASSATTAGSISGYNNPTTAATANTIVYRDSGGDISTRYFLGSYQNSSDDISTGTITYIMAKFGDNYHRSATAAKVATFISGQTMNIAGSSTSCTGNAATVTTNANLTGHITSVGNATLLGSFTSAQLLAALTDETGTGANVFATSPTLVSPILGTPTSGNLANCTFPTLNQNTTGTSSNITAYTINQSVGTGNSPTFVTVTGTAINIAGNGAGYDTYGTIGVTEPAGASNYSYYGLTRQSNIGCGFGLTGTTGALGLGANAFWFGGATSTAAGVMGSAYIAFNGSNLVAVGTADATQFRDKDNTAYYINPAGNSIVNSLTFDSNITIYKHNDRNLLIQGGGGTDAGLLGRGSSSQFAFQVYGSGTGYYGFLDSAWGGWDIQKAVSGNLYLNANGTYYLNPASTTNLNNLTVAGDVRSPIFYDSNNTAYYCDPASTSNLNALTVAGGNATIYRDLIVNGGGSGNFGNRIIVQGTATTYTYQDTTLRPTVYLNGDYPVVTLNATATTNANHGPTLQFAFNGLTTGGTTSRQIVIGANGVGSWLDFGFSGGANGDNSSYNPHNGISGYNGVTAMRLFSNGLLVGSTGAYPNAVTSTSFALDVRGTGSSNTDFRAPIFYDSNNTAYYLDPASNSVLNGLYVNAYYNLSNDYKDIYVYGDVNTYYVVLIQGEYIYSFGRYSVTRGYNWTGPDTWNTASHKGGLTLDWEWSGDTAWGGNDKAIRIIEFNESYSTMVAGLGYPVNGGVIIWLRGGGVGGAQYRIRTPIGSNTTVTAYDGVSATNHSSSTTFTAANSAVFSSRADVSNVSAEILARYPVRNAASLYSDGNSVVDTGSSTQTKSGIFASAASVRAPIFYDTDNTGYYVDPNSTSNLVGLTVANTITGSITGNAGGSSASCTGNSATTTLATKATRANGNFYIDDNYGNTVVGVYTSTRYQGVYAMGDSYKLAADGTTTGTLYGIAWSHQNAGGAAANLASHGLLILENGVFKGAWGGGSLRTPGDVRGTLFYDWDNTGYYCDPASTSNLNAITAAGNITAAQYYTGGWFRNNASGNGLYNEATGQHFYSDSANYWNVASSASTQGIRFRTGGHAGTVRGYIIADTNNDVGLLNQDGNWRVRVVGGDYTIFDGSSIRAQIFYDSNDTGYYTDPAGTSILNVVRANSYVQKSASQSLSGTVGCTIDVAAAGIHVLTLAASTTISSFTYNYRAPNPSVNTIMLVIKYGGTASITWTNVLWANGVTPTITGVSGYADVYMLTSYQGTTGVWIGTVVSQGVVSTSL